MTEIKETIFELCPGFARFFPPTRRIGEKNLGRYRKHGRIAESGQQRSEKSFIDNHVVVQQKNNFRFHDFHASIVSAAKSVIAVERQQFSLRKPFANELHASI